MNLKNLAGMTADPASSRKPASLRNIAIAMAMGVAATFSLHAEGHAARKPNVVIVFIDDLGYGDTGPFGCKDIPTPNIDRLAGEGVTCTASYITNPPCSPSRCSMMMGQYGQRFGKYGMARGLAIPEDRPTLAEFVRDHGYVTGQIGKWDIGTKAQGPLAQGFLEVARVPKPKHYANLRDAPAALRKLDGKSKYFCLTEDGKEAWLTDYNGDRMVEFVERNKEVPFFLYFSPDAVHSPSDEAPVSLKSRTSVDPKNAKRRALGGAIVSVDDQVGKLLAVLEKHKLRENTLVIFSSDNGANEDDGGSSAPYGGGKGQGTQKEGWVRVPSIFSCPGFLPQGRTYAGLTCNLDYYATIAALIQKPAPPGLDGVDMIPYLKGDKTADAHEFLFWLNNDPDDAKRRHLTAVRWKNWRLYKDMELGWQLFNLKTDPLETKDVAKKHPDVVATMAKKHATWAATLAPLGKIVAPQPNLPPIIPPGYGWAYAKTNTK
jgi:arylsulfatase A-like enzyme